MKQQTKVILFAIISSDIFWMVLFVSLLLYCIKSIFHHNYLQAPGTKKSALEKEKEKEREKKATQINGNF